VAEVAVTYYELAALDLELDILQRTVVQQQRALEAIVEQKQAGRASELGVQQFTAQVARTKALERSIRQRITEAENRMNFLIGSFPRPVQRTTAAIDTARANRTIAALPGQLLQYRPDIRQAEQELLAARADVRAARAAFYPGLIVAGGYGVQAFDPELLFTTPQSIAYTALGGLVAPLVNRNEIRARFNAADAEQVNALLTYQRTVLHAFMEVHNGLARIENLKAAARERAGETEALRGAAATASELYRSAKATYIDVLLAQQGALAAEIELVETLKQLRVAHVDIYRALGGGWR
jgi:outer membrane protein TolC